MKKNRKIIPFFKKSNKVVVERSQAEIMLDRKGKREALLKRMKDLNK